MDKNEEVQSEQIEDYCRQLGLQLRDEQDVMSVDEASQISVLGAAVVGENSNENGQPIPPGHAKLVDKDKSNFQCKKCDKNFANSRQFLKHRCILKSEEKQPKAKKRGRKPRVAKSSTEGASDEVNTEESTSKAGSETLIDEQVDHLSDHTYIKDDGESLGQTTPDKNMQCDSCQLLAELDPDSVNNPDKIPCEKCQELAVATTPTLKSTDEPTSNQESTTKKRKYSFKTKEQDCPHCYKGFHSQKRFDRHLLVCKNNLTCSFCNKDFSGTGRMAYTAHYYTHLEAMPFTCIVCSRGFIRKADLDRHKIIHTDNYSPQRCTQCGAVFASAENLAKHMHKHERLALACEKCGQQFARQATLDKHIVACQTETSCEVCGKVFKCLSKNLKSRYQEHMFIHTGEKPYKCQFCERGFRDRSTRRKHERTHTGEKPYPCTVCQRAFSQLRLLRNHVRTHTGEKPYACHICPLSFAKSCNLKYHMRVHTKEKPYHCEICNKCFTQSGTYHKHMRRHASDQTSLPASMIQTSTTSEGELVPEAENAMVHDTIPDDTFAPETIGVVVDKEDGTPEGDHDIGSDGQVIPTEDSSQLPTDSTTTIPEMPTISGEEITIIVSEGDGSSATLTTIDVDQISSILASCS